MSTLHRLKAYFGMVPADELEDYGSYAGHANHPDDEYGPDYGSDYGPDYRPDQRADERADRRRDRVDHDPGYRSRVGGRPSRWSDHEAGRDYEDYYDDEPDVPARRAAGHRPWSGEAPVRGALAVDPVREARAVAAPAEPASINDGHPMSRITTLHPRNYNEARTIGEQYRDGIPVIMNLTAMEDADAKRLVDFAAGLAFALRGSLDKVTTKVFLISPANVDVTAEDKRRIAEGSFLPPHFKQA